VKELRKAAALLIAVTLCMCMFNVISVDVKKTVASPDSQWGCSWASRSIRIDEWGWIHVSDSYYVSNNSSSELSAISINLPKGAQDITASDVSGDISITETKSNEEHVAIDVNFRISLSSAENYTFTVNYIVPINMYVKQLDSWDHYEFSFQAYPNVDFLVNKLSVSVTLPEGAKYETTSPALDHAYSNVFEQTLVFPESHNVNSTSQELSLTVKYQYAAFWAAFRPVLFFGTFIAIISVVMVARKRIKPTAPVMAVPINVLRSFVDDYDEKVSLLAELEFLEEDLAAGKVKKHEYKQRYRIINEEVSAINRELIDLKAKMKNAGGRYADAVRKIEIAELEIETARRNIDDVKVQYRTQKISKDTYNTLLADHRKRLERGKATIDDALISLRGELR